MGDRPILSLPIADIEVGPRVGFYNMDHAARLGMSMAAEGQHSPIHVKRNGNAAKRKWKLIAGLHRLRAAEAAQWTHIDAVQLADASATASELLRLELSENVDHRHRRPIERSILMVAHARLEEEIDHPGMVGESRQARGARMRHSASVTMKVAEIGASNDARLIISQASADADQGTCATVAHVGDWRARTAAAFDVSLATLKLHQRLYNGIVAHEALADLAQALNDHPLGEHLTAMTTLASVRMPDTRRKAAETILSRTDWNSMVEVMVAAGLESSTGSRVPDDAKAMDLWKRWDHKKQQAHLDWLADVMLPGQAVDLCHRLKRNGKLP